MHLDLDTERVRACIAMWRDTIAMRPGLAGGTENADRAKLLSEAAAIAAAWLDLLRMCSSSTDAELQEIRSEIAAFREWAVEGAEGLRLMAESDLIARRRA